MDDPKKDTTKAEERKDPPKWLNGRKPSNIHEDENDDPGWHIVVRAYEEER